MWETQVRSLGGENPLEYETVTHCSIPAWRISGTEEPGGLQSMGSKRVEHDLNNRAPLDHQGSPDEDCLDCCTLTLALDLKKDLGKNWMGR